MTFYVVKICVILCAPGLIETDVSGIIRWDSGFPPHWKFIFPYLFWRSRECLELKLILRLQKCTFGIYLSLSLTLWTWNILGGFFVLIKYCFVWQWKCPGPEAVHGLAWGRSSLADWCLLYGTGGIIVWLPTLRMGGCWVLLPL